MHPTKNDLSVRTRTRVCELLQARLADAIDLQLQMKQAHWTLCGPNFIALHELFDKIAGIVRDGVDEIAERIMALGGQARGTIHAAAKESSLPKFPLDINAQADQIEAVTTALAAYGKQVRKAISQSDRMGDADTADLFTGISRQIDQYLWFVEAHREVR